MSDPADRAPDPEAPLSRRGLLKSAAFAAALSMPALGALAEAATKPKSKAAPRPKPEPAAAPPKAGPDFSVCRTPAERTALEKQWKQMVETVDSLKKTELPAGSEFATRALAPARLRRGEA
jgi:hypothetical protein